MSQKELDPQTATVEEIAAAHRRGRRNKGIALAAGGICALLIFVFVAPSLPEGWTLPVLFIALAAGYIPTEEILKRL